MAEVTGGQLGKEGHTCLSEVKLELRQAQGGRARRCEQSHSGMDLCGLRTVGNSPTVARGQRRGALTESGQLQGQRV